MSRKQGRNGEEKAKVSIIDWERHWRVHFFLFTFRNEIITLQLDTNIIA